MEDATSAPDSFLTLSTLDSLLETHKLLRSKLPKCEVWIRSYIPRGQVYKLSLDNLLMKCFVVNDAEIIYLMNEDDLTDDIMGTLRGINVPVFDSHGKRLS